MTKGFNKLYFKLQKKIELWVRRTNKFIQHAEWLGDEANREICDGERQKKVVRHAL